MGPFEAFYDSPTQHPILLWCAAVAGIVYALTRKRLAPEVRGYCAALGVLSLLDAWLTSAHVHGIGALEGWASSVVPLFFVLAGDLRFLIVAVSGRAGGRLQFDAPSLGRAAGLTAIVPITTQIIMGLVPESLDQPRVMFLVYEILFLFLTAGLLRFNANVRANAWVSRVARYVMVYYGLWATADIGILASGIDAGYLLRVVPNLLYYGGLIGVIAWSAQRDAGDERS